jgi:hypothetical protein
MAKKKVKEWNINDDGCKAEYYERMKKCVITELVDCYLRNYEDVIYAMKYLMEYYPNGLIFYPDGLNGFEGSLQRANFNIGIKFLCEQIEKYIHNHSIDHIKLLNNGIANKIQRVESMFEVFVSVTDYNKFKTTKIYYRYSYMETMLICSDEFYSRCSAFCKGGGERNNMESWYGTLEILYTETITLLSVAKDKINDLFTQKELKQIESKSEVTDTSSNGNNENPFPFIFKNDHAFDMFMELKNLTVKQNSIVADYSYIFHKMKHKDLGAINKSVTQPVFIEFLNSTQNTDISVNKLPFRNPSSKQPVYSTVLDKYKAKIIAAP